MALVALACYALAVESDGRRQRLLLLAAHGLALATVVDWLNL